MPEEKFPTPELNLLSGDELENTSGGKFIKWALTWGRRIVVLTELIVIGAFLSRFWLDTVVADLNDKIDRQKAVVLALADFEKEFRTVSDKVDKAGQLEKATSTLTVYDQTKKLIPNGVTLVQLSINPQMIAFAGSADENLLETMVTGFQNSPNFSNINVERIAKKDVYGVVDFSLKADYGHKQ
ncbi:PilN domain-containing protein [Patescibacteria group bacterium]|nr:PilN domain-containing protein [Patescibacteria group bacterium]